MSFHSDHTLSLLQIIITDPRGVGGDDDDAGLPASPLHRQDQRQRDPRERRCGGGRCCGPAVRWAAKKRLRKYHLKMTISGKFCGQIL